ncbi:hypothetical protein AMK59_3693 [Oryctes borbonicus]|uniref:Deoxyuridine 5'-triphosphate nucleotidohydrolase n=1 Tax=Oryctes borbonicus TaxID=1629725 RepID=A0A0T6B860_9SCAR|nr:hypothetical protein AMK59_3693 [Oryctes borbonicus]
MRSIDTAIKMILKFSKAIPEAYAPTRGSTKAAGYDLRSAYDYIIPAHGKEMVDTGIKIELPEGCYGLIAPRAGLAAKNFIDVGGKCYSNVIHSSIILITNYSWSNRRRLQRHS